MISRQVLFADLFLLLFVSLAHGELIVDHQRHPYGGLGADSAFMIQGNPGIRWEFVADDFVLQKPTTIGHVNWLGFYDRDNPPTTETMRIRFYGARVGDGLPDDSNILYEQTISNPTRTATGEHIAVGISPREYLFETDLDNPVSLQPLTRYWLEAAQIGDSQTAFRWEFSIADFNGQAFKSQSTNGEWIATSPSIEVDTAFQLWDIPEPSSVFLFATVSLAIFANRQKQRGQVVWNVSRFV